MKKLAITALLLALMAGFASAQSAIRKTAKTSPSSAAKSPSHPQGSSPHPMTAEEAFYYYVAIYGAPDNVIDRYGSYFDAPNYTRAMKDEFQRAKYRVDIQRKIESEVKKLNFDQKFIFVGSTSNQGYTSLGDYSFDSHSFPVGPIPTKDYCIDAARTSFGNCNGSILHVNVFDVANAANRSDFTWSLPMPEAEASAFVKSRAGAGVAGRRVTARITFSIINMKGLTEDSLHGRAASFSPFIHSVEIFADPGLNKKLGVITASAGTPESAFGPDVARASQSESKVIGEYPYIAAYPEYWRQSKTPIKGTIKLTDVGIELSGEKSDGTAKVIRVGFFDTLGAGSSNSVVKLSRLNFTFGISDFRIVWNFNWNGDHTPFVFAKAEERDRFFADLVQAMQDWATKYPQLAVKKLNVDQQVYSQ